MKLILNLALKEILGHKRFSIFFSLNISLGMIAFTCLDAFKNSFDESLKSSSKLILTADLSVSARRLLSQEEIETSRNLLPKETKTTQKISLYSMASSSLKSRLMNIVGIEEDYPFYGSITLQKKGTLDKKSHHDISSDFNAWVYPETLVQLGLKMGDKLKIGTKEFTITDTILDETSSDFSGLTFAPKIYIGMSSLNQTDLIKKGSTLWNTIYYKLPNPGLTEVLAENLNNKLNDPGINVRTPDLKSQRSGAAVSYLMDYLGLVSLVGFLIAALGVGYFYFIYFGKRLKDLIIFRTLGLTPSQVIQVFSLQVILLGSLSAGLSLCITYFVSQFLPILFLNILPIDVLPMISFKTIMVCVFMSTIGSLCICYPLIYKVKHLKPASLFQEHARMSLDLNKRSIINFLPALFLYWVISVLQAKSWIIGSLFFSCFIGSAIIFSVLYLLFTKLLSVKQNSSNKVYIQLGLKYLTRQPFHSLIAFLAISMAVLLINFVDQIKSGLYNEIKPSNNIELPSLFMFDIQDEQVADLKSFLSKNSLSFLNISPMIRARLEKVNDELFSKPSLSNRAMTREEEQSNRFKNRGFNLSYRKELSSSETIVSGLPFKSDNNPDRLPQISVEKRFADRLNFKLGDILEFSIQGIEVSGKIVNIRHIKWSSFQPNFFIQFEDGVLNEAPKTWVASIAKVDSENIEIIQSQLSDTFPNISIIDVKRLSKKLIEISEQMIFILNFMASITLIVGFIILIAICHNQTKIRQWDLNLLKILGTPASTLRKSFYFEFGLLCFLASSIGSLFAILISSIIGYNVFDRVYMTEWRLPLISILSLTFFGIVVAHIVLSHILKKRSLIVLQEG